MSKIKLFQYFLKASKKTIKKLQKNGNFYAKPRFGKQHFFSNALTQNRKTAYT
jgi:hypothetical protein